MVPIYWFSKNYFSKTQEVIEQEDKYWTEDEKLDEVYAANAEEEYTGQSLYEELGTESYLEEL